MTWKIISKESLDKVREGNRKRSRAEIKAKEKTQRMKDKISDYEQKIKSLKSKVYEIESNMHTIRMQIQTVPGRHTRWDNHETQTFPEETEFYRNIKSRVFLVDEEEGYKTETAWQMEDGSFQSGGVCIPCIAGSSEMDEENTYFRIDTYEVETK